MKMTMKFLPLVFLLVFVTGCQSLPQREPVIVSPTVMRSVSFKPSSRTLKKIEPAGTYQVSLYLNIDKYGKVDNIRIKESSGNKLLDKHSTRRAQRIIFHAATEDGKFVKSTATLPITYEIPEDVRYR